MRAFAKGFLAALVLLVLALIGLYLSMSKAHAVTDAPILMMPPSDAVIDIRLAPGSLTKGMACVAWWEKDENPYGDYHLVHAALDVGQLPAVMVEQVQFALNARDISALTKIRTQDMNTLVNVEQPCIDKLGRMPFRWSAPPITSGQRPAFLLNPDGTRGKQSGYVATTMPDKNSGTTIPTPCMCVVRAASSASTYCLTALSKATAESPDRVTLCRTK